MYQAGYWGSRRNIKYKISMNLATLPIMFFFQKLRNIYEKLMINRQLFWCHLCISHTTSIYTSVIEMYVNFEKVTKLPKVQNTQTFHHRKKWYNLYYTYFLMCVKIRSTGMCCGMMRVIWTKNVFSGLSSYIFSVFEKPYSFFYTPILYKSILIYVYPSWWKVLAVLVNIENFKINSKGLI